MAKQDKCQMMFPDPRVSGQRPTDGPRDSETYHVYEEPLGTLFGGKFGRSRQCPKCGRAACRLESSQGLESWVHEFSIQLTKKGNPVVRNGLVCK